MPTRRCRPSARDQAPQAPHYVDHAEHERTARDQEPRRVHRSGKLEGDDRHYYREDEESQSEPDVDERELADPCWLLRCGLAHDHRGDPRGHTGRDELLYDRALLAP